MPKRELLSPIYFERRSKRQGECWYWHPRDGKESYGQLRIDGKNWLAHRASWMIHFGEIPEGMMVCHKCDTPRCVNPNHLFLGTTKDNINDALNKNRMYFQNEGRDFSFTRKARVKKLNEIDVSEIRKSIESLAILSKRYDVSMSCISMVRRGKRKKL